MNKKNKDIQVALTISYKGTEIAYNENNINSDSLEHDAMYRYVMEDAITKLVPTLINDAKEEYEKIKNKNGDTN